jgi:hypothetical protein
MADNVYKAVVDAIGEADTEIGGQLLTQLRESHLFGQEDAFVETASPTQLSSLRDVFAPGHAGYGIDVLIPYSGVPTGNEGSYVINTVVDAQHVTLMQVADGSAAAFTDQDPVRWRFSTLRVVSAYSFPTNDRKLGLYVGEEPDPVLYAKTDLTPNAQKFEGLGAHDKWQDGYVETGALTTLKAVGRRFTAASVGATVYVLPDNPVTGNEGPQLITGYTDERTVTVSPGFAAAQTEMVCRLKTYADTGYLTDLSPRGAPRTRSIRRQGTPVIDASGSYSQLDQLRRALLVEYAEGPELDRIGRRLAVIRPRGVGDETFRRLIQVLAFLPRGTIYGIELVLDALYPEGGWEIYEDLINYPCTVFLLLPSIRGDSTEFEGKGFFAPTGTAAGAVIAYGDGGRELQTSASATSVAVTHDITSIIDVRTVPDTQELEMDALPSAEAPAWTFNTEGSGTPAEGAVFSVVNLSGSINVLEQTVPSAPSRDGGNYSRASTRIDRVVGSYAEISAWWRGTDFTTVADRPWFMGLLNAGLNLSAYLRWNETELALTDASGAIPAGVPAAVTPSNVDLGDGNWHRITLRMEVQERGYRLFAAVDGQRVFSGVDLSLFGAAAASTAVWGSWDTGTNQEWTCQWDRVDVDAVSARNYYNRASTGQFTGGGPNFTDGTNPFVAGDVGKRIRTCGYEPGGGFVPKNSGVWKIASYVGVGEITISGLAHGPAGDRITQGVLVSGGNAVIGDVPDRPGAENGALIRIADGDAGVFRKEDGPTVLDDAVGGYDPVAGGSGDGKSIVISGSGAGNDGAYPIIEVISPWLVRVDKATPFVTEEGLTWAFNNTFDASGTDIEYEVIEQGSFAVKTVTLGDSLPAVNDDVQVWYTSVLSAQLMLDETVRNDGSGGAEPNIYYPLYIFDVDRATREIMDDVTASGVIPEYERYF